jgi:LysR family nitrogen assimilation transcriptional regulator
MDLKQLRYFRQVAESGSFSAAAGLLRVAQPALSRQIQALERELGVTLCHRNGRGILLTAAGHALHADAVRLLADADRTRHRMREFSNTLVGEATIGLSPTVSRLLTLPLTSKLRSDYPGLRLRIAEAFSGVLLEWLQTGRLDAAILYHVPAGGAAQSETLASEPLAIIGNAIEPPFPVGAPVTPPMLSGRPLVLSTPSHGLRQTVEQHAARAGTTLDVQFEFDSLDATIALVQQGLACTILPPAVVRSEIAAGSLLAWPLLPELARPLVLATAPQRQGAIASHDLAILLRTVIADMSDACGWQPARGREVRAAPVPEPGATD